MWSKKMKWGNNNLYIGCEGEMLWWRQVMKSPATMCVCTVGAIGGLVGGW